MIDAMTYITIIILFRSKTAFLIWQRKIFLFSPAKTDALHFCSSCSKQFTPISDDNVCRGTQNQSI